MANYKPYKQDKQVEDMNIHEKRKYAKYIGVVSPTTLFLAELDEAIRLRELEIGSLKNIVGVYEMTAQERETLIYSANAQSRISRGVSGYFIPFPEGDGVLRRELFAKLYEHDIYVPNDMVEEYGLKFGDSVSCDIITVVYNKTNIIRQVKYVNDRSVRSITMREDISTMQKSLPQKPMKFASSNSIVGLMHSLLFVGEGQSVGIVTDRDSAKQIAFEIVTSLYRSFDGHIFCIYDRSLEDALKSVYNPFAFTPDDVDENLEILIQHASRLIEEGRSVAVVCYSGRDAVIGKLYALAGRYRTGSATVFAVGTKTGRADGVITLCDSKVVVSATGNKYTSTLMSSDKYKKLLIARDGLCDDYPDGILEEINSRTLKTK